ncbi:hypothetical protein [uncultured Vagococcus sp.]|uniref:hypothetical protein n=1 Tax=uncultured Vagococcus sp. TaxID=189676 RepID=UPI0028D0238F|nr:hypothetical protein [uncultured Vagococcus sp.]
MNKKLIQLLLTRYWKGLSAIAGLIIAANLFFTITSVKEWQSVQQLADRPENERQSLNFSPDENGQYELYFDDTTNSTVMTDDYTTFRDQRLQFFNTRTPRWQDSRGLKTNQSDYYSESPLFFVAISIITGFSLFFFDLKTNFNTLLFSSSFSKKQLYWHKHLLVGGTLGLSFIAGKIVTILILLGGIPSHYFNGTLGMLINSSLSTVFIFLTIYAISSFIGLLLGEWISGVMTILGFWLSFMAFTNGFTELFTLFNRHILGKTVNDSDYFVVNPINQWLFELNNISAPVSVFIVLSAVFISTLIMGLYWFKQASLENNGQYLLFDSLRQPVLVFFLFYTLIATNASQWISEERQIGLLLLQAILTLMIAYLIGRLTIYRRINIGKKSSLGVQGDLH